MRKIVALLVALVSGVYVLFGWVPDPVPFLDEGLALMVFLNALAYLGFDLRGYFRPSKSKKNQEDRTIDID